MTTEIDPNSASTKFLAELGKSASADDEFDTDLTEILVSHILKAELAEDAVKQAKDEILALAKERAAQCNKEPEND